MGMTMTPRDVVLANVAQANPDRPGFDFDNNRRQDMLWSGISASRTWKSRKWEEKGFEYSTDEWGNLWYRIQGKSQSGEIFEPALKDWKALESLTAPDLDDPARYEEMAKRFRENPEHRFKIAFMPVWVFATSRYMRKMEIYFTDLFEYREEIERLHDIVVSLAERMIHRMADAGADGFMYCEDLGIQDRTLISPAMWRDIFRPHYLRLTGAAHARGLKVFMHSCGYNWALIDDLAEAGVDCFQFDQPYAYDMPALAAKLRSLKTGLWAPVDIQKVLPTGDKAFIEAEARRLVETFRGGLILKNYGDLKGIGVKPEWDQWAYEALVKAAGITG
jgi:uroporphyrinogen decarboxylase